MKVIINFVRTFPTLTPPSARAGTLRGRGSDEKAD
jgi:hypothetical protein